MYKIILTSQKNTVPEEERLLCSESLSWSLMKYIWSDCYTCRDLQLDGAVGQLLHWHPTKRNKTPLFTIVLHALFHSVPLPPNHLLVSLPSICSFRLPSLSLVSITASTQLSPVHYGAATAWVSPPVVTSCIRVPEAGRSDPAAQLKNILEENKDVETMPF